MARGPRSEPATTADLIARRKLYPVREAASLLGMGRSKVYVLAGNGDITILRIGGRAYISEDEIDRFIAAAQPADISSAS